MPAASNPLLADWTTPFGLPPFRSIEPDHFRPAFETALAAHRAEIEAIAEASLPATFANTIDALELAGEALRRVAATFFNLAGTDTTPELQAIEREIAPALARHSNAIYQDSRLFARIQALVENRDTLGLSAEQARVLERYHTAFLRNGAGLDAASRRRSGEIAERLATLGTSFAQNLLADEQAFTLVLDGEDDLAGLPAFVRDAAASAAAARGLAGKHVITLARSSIEPFLTFSARRDLRRRAFEAWIARGANGGATDNRAIIEETVALRAERARLLGYPSFAHYRLADSMAKTPEAALDLLHSVWTPARERALADAAELQAIAQENGLNEPIRPWDWRYLAEQRRTARFAIDPGEVEPFLPLDAMIEAAFYTAGRLFGLAFAERHDLELYHPDVRAFEVTDQEGRHVGLFLGDYFARESKRSGAWMSAYRAQQKLRDDIRPIITNVMNFSKPAPGAPALLGFDDARTLFHEFGHALHGLLSDVTYPYLAGTSVDRDFVELPSQLFEHWLEQPAVLERFARHHETGRPIPEALVRRLKEARRADQGFATIEYTACALVDLELHLSAEPAGLDITAFETDALARLGMPEAIVMRHRPPHFAHLFSGGGYAAGNSADPAVAYRAFRGQDPSPDALLAKRGLLQPA